MSPSHESPISLHSLPHRGVEMKKNTTQHIAEEEEEEGKEEIHSLGCFSTTVLGESGLQFLPLGEAGMRKGGEAVLLSALGEKGCVHLLVWEQVWMDRGEAILSERMVLGEMGWCPSRLVVALEKRGLPLSQAGDWEGTGVVNLGCSCCSCSSVWNMRSRQL